ncbi:Uncharacterised protein [Yersinia aldovae]|uniref:Uncharacterized protein n=1 Tax=Yersinia aldovae TaxID=29483 RepID=A0ABM9SPB6_YERAL|nr:Uncharacterised protein [Yersinia aldovae]CNK49428.1 Uncharacterised protein [Yersinia aldovae]
MWAFYQRLKGHRMTFPFMYKKILNSKLIGYIVGVLIAIGFGESFITTREEAERFAK